VTAGVAPTWPTDRALFAVADGWLVRSDDHGATWRYLPEKFEKVRYIWPAPGIDRSGIVLALRSGANFPASPGTREAARRARAESQPGASRTERPRSAKP
jgi:hypothetical protein